MLDARDLTGLRRQRLLSRLFAFPSYALLIAAARLYCRYRVADLAELRREVREKLSAGEGPVIWAANHLTMIDSFLIYWALTPFRGAADERLIPWSTPEYKNYYRLGGAVFSRVVRGYLYLCRCIPIQRDGEDAEAVRRREVVFQKCAQVLRDGGSAFVFPEATRARNGWLDASRPKDFLGRLALEVPRARFLCVYLRGESQLGPTVMPVRGETLRAEVSIIPATAPGETSARQISERLFKELARLQERWWKKSSLPKNCAGNDVVDLKSASLEENINAENGDADEEWIGRHLTPKELSYWREQPPERRFRVFWKFFAAKEASHKALARTGVVVQNGAFFELEADLFLRKVKHLPTGLQLDIRFTDDEADRLHCVAVLRGGRLGDDQDPGDLLWRVEAVPAGVSPSAFARDLLVNLIVESSDDLTPAALAVTSGEDGLPVVLKKGRPWDLGASLSHNGRYAACSFMIS